MRKLLTTVICGVAVWTGLKAAPVIDWVQTTHNFGAFDEALGVVSCVFEGVNTGDEPLVVYSARANCGCTVPHYDRHPVAPGDTLRINVGYNAAGRPGHFEKTVTVNSNADPGKCVLRIEGTVIGSTETLRTRYPFSDGSLKLRQNHLNYGEVAKGSSRSLYIEGYNQSDEPVVPRIEGAPSYIDVTVKPDVVPPGEPFVLSTIFRASACQQWDVVTDSIILAAPDGSRLPITTLASVYDDFRDINIDPYAPPALKIDPEKIDLGRISRAADNRPLQYTVTLQNTSRRNVTLRRVYTIAPGVTVKIKGDNVIKPGKKCKLTVEISPKAYADKNYIDAKILIITDDPTRPRNIVEVLGEVINQ